MWSYIGDLPSLYRYWLSVGAQPSEPVQRLLFRSGVLPPPPMLAMGRKGGPRDTRPIDPMTGRILTSESSKNVNLKSDDNDGEVDEDESATTSWSLYELSNCFPLMFLNIGGWNRSWLETECLKIVKFLKLLLLWCPSLFFLMLYAYLQHHCPCILCQHIWLCSSMRWSENLLIAKAQSTYPL